MSWLIQKMLKDAEGLACRRNSSKRHYIRHKTGTAGKIETSLINGRVLADDDAQNKVQRVQKVLLPGCRLMPQSFLFSLSMIIINLTLTQPIIFVKEKAES